MFTLKPDVASLGCNDWEILTLQSVQARFV